MVGMEFPKALTRLEPYADESDPDDVAENTRLGAVGSLLEKLAEEKVFDLRPSETGGVAITESCDGYYHVDMTKADLLRLIDELRAIAAVME